MGECWDFNNCLVIGQCQKYIVAVDRLFFLSMISRHFYDISQCDQATQQALSDENIIDRGFLIR